MIKTYSRQSAIITETEQHLSADQQKIAGWNAEFVELEPALLEAVKAEELSSSALQEAELAMQSWQTQWDEFNHKSGRSSTAS